jgi:AcrR family transcriptional regulator
VVEFQRARLLAAMTEVAAERGAASVTVTDVVERAGVSRRTFYELFEDREACFLAALDDAIARVSGVVLDAYEPQAKWAERIRGALAALLVFLDTEPGVGRLLVVESLGAGPAAMERRSRVLAHAVAVVDEGRREARAGAGVTPLTAEAAAGAVLSVIHARLPAPLRVSPDMDRLASSPAGVDGPGAREGASGRLVDLASPLMSMLVLPYLGSAAARRELKRPAPEVEPRPAPSGASNPLRELDMRLTYRTVRVLLAVAASPGGSNRVVSNGAGVSDQGQISKLLSRLEKLGLVSNTGLGPGRGAPNAWTLTQQGEEVSRIVAARAPVA